jgi:hypothetical protein
MPTWRKLHTKVTRSLDVNDMPDDFTRLLWVLLPLHLDKQGRSIDNASFVKSGTMPMRDDVTPEQVQDALDWYAEHGMLVRYEVDGRQYFYVPTFSEYQGQRRRESESDYPAPPDQVHDEVHDQVQDQRMSKSRLDVDVDVDVDVEKRGAKRGARAPTPSSNGDDSNLQSEPEPERKKPKTPPAILAFQSAAHRYPTKSWWKRVDATVGTAEPDVERWKKVVFDWVGRGWNPTNVKGMLDAYLNGGIQPLNRGSPKQSQSDRIAEIESWVAQELGGG